MPDVLDTACTTLAGLANLAPSDELLGLAGVEAIARAVPHCNAPQRLDVIAAALPRKLGGYTPELGLALAGLALTLAHHIAPDGPVIAEDLESLAPRLQVAWLRVRLTAGTARLDTLSETLLLRSLQGWSLADVADPGHLIEHLANAVDPRLRLELIERLPAAVRHLAISPEQACVYLLRSTHDPDPSVRRAGFAGLTHSDHTRLDPATRAEHGRVIRAGLGTEDLEIVCACVSLAASSGAREWLLDLAFDDQRAVDQRTLALTGLGPLACEGDIGPALELAAADPLGFGACVRGFVLEAHRHGVFVREPQIPALLSCFDTHHGWTGEALVRVGHIVRVQLVAALAALPADDRRWIRRAAILAACVDVGAAQLIAELLRATADPHIAAALVDAAGRSPDYVDEGPLLDWLDVIPEPVIAVLRVKGGAAAARRLRALVEDRSCPAGLRPSALDALWALSRDRRTLLRELCGRLGPRAAGLTNTARLSTRDDLAAGIWADAPWAPSQAHELEPIAALSLVCEAGRIESLPEVTRLFRIVFLDYVGKALAGDFTIKRIRMPELEQQIYRYGRHLIADGRSVRRWIEAGPDTGRELTLALAIEWLGEEPPAPVSVALLESIARQQPTGPSLRRIEAYWRHRNPEVQRAALEAILAAGEGARGLELSICRLSDTTDARILRQALAAVASLEAAWAEPMVIDALARPQMAIKKEAAAALAVIGTRRCVPALVEWLAIHDNTGFRAALREALVAVAGAGTAAILVDALSIATERRHQLLLRQALSNVLTLAATLRLARSSRAADLELVEAALDGSVRLADASPEDLVIALHRGKLRRLVINDDPGRDLRLEGFTPAAALGLVRARTPKIEREALAVVGAGLVEWLRWLTSDAAPADSEFVAALALVLAAATPAHAIHRPTLITLLESHLGALDPGTSVAFIERCLLGSDVTTDQRARALAIVRALPISAELGGLRQFSLLAKLGAVRDRQDLERCLAACRVGPNLEQVSAQLLREAFAIPNQAPDELERLGRGAADALEQLRTEAAGWYRMSESEADVWLSEMLATRPLDLPPLRALPQVTRARKPAPNSVADLERLLAIVRSEAPATRHDRPARERAAEAILAWPDARMIAGSWATVLEVYLSGGIELSAAATAKLAGVLEAWPDDPAAAARARGLIVHFDVGQRRRWLPVWIAAWQRGQPDADSLLAAVDQQLLIPHARAHAAAGEFGLVRLLRPDGSLALAELIEFVGTLGPAAVAELEHLIPAEAPVVESKLDDPIAGMELDALVATIAAPKVELGLAVRAIHALASLGERSFDALERFALDRRDRLRSAALRALRKAAPRERSLQVSVSVLEIETRRDVILSLLASLGHARYKPGLRHLVGFAIHSDPKLRAGAENALLAWGRDVVPELSRVARKARPDRRRVYEELITTLVSADD